MLHNYFTAVSSCVRSTKTGLIFSYFLVIYINAQGASRSSWDQHFVFPVDGGGVNNLGTPFMVTRVMEVSSGTEVGSCKLPVFPFIYEDGHVLQVRNQVLARDHANLHISDRCVTSLANTSINRCLTSRIAI